MSRHGRQEDAERAVAEEAAAFGPMPSPPRYLRGDARAAWENWIARAHWLSGAEEAMAIAFCETWAAYRADPGGFSAARLAQLRALSGTLGLSDPRAREGSKAAIPDDSGKDFF